MKRVYPPLSQLQAENGQHKTIPPPYEEVILRTLHHFPELKETKIEFRLTREGDHPHETKAAVARLLLPGARMEYTVLLLDEAAPPLEQALFRNLPLEAQSGLIAHELSHILQLEQQGATATLRHTFQVGDERSRERQADISVIEHGLGFELYTYATYIRQIEGFLEAHPHSDVNRMHPSEILEALPPEQLQELPRF